MAVLQIRYGPPVNQVRTNLQRTLDDPSDKISNSHIIRAFFDLSYETMEVTGPQMVLVMKLTTFAWNVYDGRRPAEVCLLSISSPIPPPLTQGTGLGQVATRKTSDRPEIPLPPRFPRLHSLFPRFPRRPVPRIRRIRRSSHRETVQERYTPKAPP